MDPEQDAQSSLGIDIEASGQLQKPAGMPVDSSQVFSSVRWMGVRQITSQVVSLAVSVTLARLLAPEDFGLMTMALTITALASMISTLGVVPAIVQRRELSELLLRSLATVGLGMGVGLSLILAAASRSVAAFYGEPRVAWVIAAISVSFTLSAVGFVPEGLLQRELRFRTLVIIDLAALVVGSTTAIILAWRGFGVWALVASSIFGTGTRSLLLLLSSPWRFAFGFGGAEIRGVIGFSASILGFNLTQYFMRQSDKMIIGRSLGAVALGYYDYGYRFYMYPVDAITGVLIGVMFPVFSRLQDDVPQLGRTFLRANGAIALLTFPMMAGLAAVADPFVRVVLGDKWAPVIPLVQILAPVGLVQSIGVTPGQLFLARGRAALRMWWSLGYAAVVVAAFFAGIPWGILGVATAYAIVMVPVFIVGFWIALRLVDLGLADLWRTLRVTLVASVGMAAVVIGIRLVLEAAGVPRPLVLALCVCVGGVLYGTAVRLAEPDVLRDLHRMLPEGIRDNSLVRWMLVPRTGGNV